MKVVGFIGAYEKTDLIIYIAKMFTLINKKVLVVDATNIQRSKYIIPNLEEEELYYVNNYQDIDIAIGFRCLEDIADNLGTSQLNYDLVLVDADSTAAFESFELANAEKNYFVTTLGLYPIKKGIEIIKNVRESVTLTKVVFAQKMKKEQNRYLDYLTMECKVNWSDQRIYFPLESGDQTAIIENEMVSAIRYKNLSGQYQEGLYFIAQDIGGQEELKNIIKAIKNYEKGE